MLYIFFFVAFVSFIVVFLLVNSCRISHKKPTKLVKFPVFVDGSTTAHNSVEEQGNEIETFWKIVCYIRNEWYNWLSSWDFSENLSTLPISTDTLMLNIYKQTHANKSQI